MPGELAGDDDVVDRLVEGRPGVDLPAVGLDVPGDLPGAAAGRALEEHVLVQVRESGLIRPLVGAAGLHPHLEGGHPGGVLLLEDDGESVGKCVALSHGTSEPDTGCRGRQGEPATISTSP